jgi:hypothetical protein
MRQSISPRFENATAVRGLLQNVTFKARFEIAAQRRRFRVGTCSLVSKKRRMTMKTLSVLLVATALPLTFVTAAQADWSRKSTWVGPYGKQVDVNAAGSCVPGTCSRSKTWTGPNGKTATKNVTVQAVAPGVYERNVTTVGPNGRVNKRKSTVTIY